MRAFPFIISCTSRRYFEQCQQSSEFYVGRLLLSMSSAVLEPSGSDVKGLELNLVDLT